MWHTVHVVRQGRTVLLEIDGVNQRTETLTSSTPILKRSRLVTFFSFVPYQFSVVGVHYRLLVFSIFISICGESSRLLDETILFNIGIFMVKIYLF